MKPLGTLDRYILRQWFGTFALSAFGIPAVAVLIRMSEFFGKVSDKGVPLHENLLGFAMLYPGQLAMLFPAGVLFATVFTLNAMGRHSELTAAKAGGVSFYRLILPMLVMATLAIPVNFYLQEVAAVSGERQRELHKEKVNPRDLTRFDFAFESEQGWTWTVRELQRNRDYLGQIMMEAPVDSTGQRWTITADSARWNDSTAHWTLYGGGSHVVADSGGVLSTIKFRSLVAKVIDQPPGSLVNTYSKAEEMRTAQLRHYLDRLERTGVRPGMLAVDLPLKYAVPVACLVVALFGAPLAVTNPRAGAALGLAIAMGTTLVYLTGIQIMKAIGGKDLVSPLVAAWSMNGVFLILAVLLMWRVRS